MKRWFVLLIAALCLGVASAAGAQIAAGNIYGTVADQQAACSRARRLARREIDRRRATHDRHRQPGPVPLPEPRPGTYKRHRRAHRFHEDSRDVIVTTGVNVDLPFTLRVEVGRGDGHGHGRDAGRRRKKIGTSTTLTTEELQGTPQSRDPWAVLKTVPGVIVDRVNVGGNESGQQSGFVGKGALATDTMWNLDGVVITDINSGGASSSYFDFDAFEEIERHRPAATICKVADRRHRHQLRHQARHEPVQGHVYASRSTTTAWSRPTCPTSSMGDRAALPAAIRDKANHTDQILDWGFDIGGPIVKDKLWFWGSYGKKDIRIIRLNQTERQDDAQEHERQGELGGDARTTGLVLLLQRRQGEVRARRRATSANEADSFLWNQGNFYPEKAASCPAARPLEGRGQPHLRLELLPQRQVRVVRLGLRLRAARRRRTRTAASTSTPTTAYGSCVDRYTARKPWHIAGRRAAAPSRRHAAASHEFKFGFGYRRNPSDSTDATGAAIRSSAIINRRRRRSRAGLSRSAYVHFIGEIHRRCTSATRSARAA